MANIVTKVVNQCEKAKDNHSLDLSDCQLMQVPDAVYHLMRHTDLNTCDLSNNVITKIPPKFAIKFSTITELNLSHNQLSKLPEELVELQDLERLDISHNTFIVLPSVTCQIPQLRKLYANDNSIIEVDVEQIKCSPALEFIDLRGNTIPQRTHALLLEDCGKTKIELSPRLVEDWEDLTV